MFMIFDFFNLDIVHKKGGWKGRMSLRDTRKDTLLEGLKLTSHVIAQRDIFSRSAIRRAAEMIGSSTIIKRLVS